MKKLIKERGILFRTDMVRSILQGRKTQTRRLGKIQHDDATELAVESALHATKGKIYQATYRAFPTGGTARWALCECPYGIIGDRLWVKETFAEIPIRDGSIGWAYRADGDEAFDNIQEGYEWIGKWNPPIFMPRKASRITLEITAIRAQRLQDISKEDAIAEGIIPGLFGGTFHAPGCALDRDAIGAYEALWESINGKGSWKLNPWVWVITFNRIFLKPKTEIISN